MTKYGNFVSDSKGFINPVFELTTLPSEQFPNKPFDIEDAGESYSVLEPTPLVSAKQLALKFADNTAGDVVARITDFRFTNPLVIRGRNIEIFASQNRQPLPAPDRGERIGKEFIPF